MVGWVYSVAGNRFAELITHSKMRSIPKNLAVLVIACPRSEIYTCGTIHKSEWRELEGSVRVTRPW
jgi:hypothetical protein